MKQTFEKFWFRPYTPIVFLIILVFILARFAYPPIQQTIQSQRGSGPSPKSAGNSAVLGDNVTIIEQVGKLIILPADETPSIATVADLEKLQEQPFFKNAKTGDKVLIYTKARKAIIYDPANNKIVEVTQIAAPTPTSLISPTPPIAPISPTP